MADIEARPVQAWLRSGPWAALAIAGAVAALATIPYAPNWWFRLILPRLRPHVTLWFVAAGALILGGLIAWAWAAGPVNRMPALGALTALMIVYVLILLVMYRGEAPAKKWHIIQYGLLAGVTFNAVRVDVRRWRGLLLGCAFLLVIATADEVSQNYVPMRTFRWLDLFGNYLGSFLGFCGWLTASPHSPWRKD
jgi:hypothetical protein